ncbi:MAG: glycoside hydrolase family 3 C-terminal domain-containing protein, partial [Clostridia bacterium]|nr:glycoside hydrolase family 3 C-terminal domain-containing protein [Clostridia bacterium]
MEKWIRARYLPGTPLGKDGKRITASPENIGISRRAAREGMVLLKNEGGVLPLSEETKIALFGKGTFDYVKGGGGSGDVIVPYVRNIFDGLSEMIGADRIYEGTVSFYRDYVDSQYEEGWVPGLVREPEVPEDLLLDARAFTDTAVVSISRFSGESWDRKTGKTDVTAAEAMNGEVVKMSDMLFEKGDFYLSDAERKMLDRVSSVFKKTIVVLNVGGMVETACYKEDPRIDAVLMAFQGGMEGACAAAELLMGKDVPTGKLTDTYARELTDYPGTEHFYDSNEYVDYTEDIYVGYRFFETIPGMKEKVVYPFGYGLSYTSFSLSDQKVSFTDTEITASTVVTNIGNSRGREVVQVYYTAPKGKLGKPAIELGGYIKTRMLSPGEKETVSVSFPISSMSSFDDLGKISRS